MLFLYLLKSSFSPIKLNLLKNCEQPLKFISSLCTLVALPLYCGKKAFLWHKKEKSALKFASEQIFCNKKCRHLPIFPVRLQTSIFGTTQFNYCVRNGNRWNLSVISTGCKYVPVLPSQNNIPHYFGFVKSFLQKQNIYALLYICAEYDTAVITATVLFHFCSISNK